MARNPSLPLEGRLYQLIRKQPDGSTRIDFSRDRPVTEDGDVLIRCQGSIGDEPVSLTIPSSS